MLIHMGETEETQRPIYITRTLEEGQKRPWNLPANSQVGSPRDIAALGALWSQPVALYPSSPRLATRARHSSGGRFKRVLSFGTFV